jgi:hypothetical protein
MEYIQDLKLKTGLIFWRNCHNYVLHYVIQQVGAKQSLRFHLFFSFSKNFIDTVFCQSKYGRENIIFSDLSLFV